MRGDDILNQNEHYEMYNDGAQRNLRIKNVTSNDSAEYCVDVGQLSQKIQLKVEGTIHVKKHTKCDVFQLYLGFFFLNAFIITFMYVYFVHFANFIEFTLICIPICYPLLLIIYRKYNFYI